MKLKKYIKLKEDLPEEPMTEREQEIYNSLVQRVRQNAEGAVKTKKSVSLWKILTPAISFAVAIAITLTCVFTLNSTKELTYNDDKIKTTEISFSAMQGGIINYDLSFIEQFTDKIFMSYDLQSNDKLFYSVFANIDFSSIKLDIVINEKYNYNFSLKEETNNKQLTDYSVTYTKESSRGKPQINYRGWLKVNTETVYFDYVQIPALGDDAFFESLQQIIQVKK